MIQRRIGSIAVGGVLLAVGLAFTWAGIPRTSALTCTRDTRQISGQNAGQIACQRQDRILWWIPLKTQTLSGLQRIKRAEGENAYDSVVYLLVLDGLGHDGIYRTIIFGNTLDEGLIEQDLQRAQGFLADPTQPSLTLVRYEDAWGFVLLGLPFAAFGLWTMVYRYK